MSGNLHERAQQLVAQERVEGISASDSAWLSAHLQDCHGCANFAQSTSFALSALRTMATPLPPGLVERTQFRVGLRAQQLLPRESRHRALWIAAGISWAAGVASAPLVWRMFAWFGESAGVPKLVWEVGFGLWWAVPALVAAVVLLAEHEKQVGESSWVRQRGE
jgi:hypothetical protein